LLLYGQMDIVVVFIPIKDYSLNKFLMHDKLMHIMLL
jgi:hypothetical protein